jgi:hypothetical protein
MGRTPCQAGSSRASATGGAGSTSFRSVAPFGAAPVRQELTFHDPAGRREPPQRARDHRHTERVTRRDRIRAERPVRPCVPRDQVAQRIRQRFGERLRDAGRQRHAQRVAEAPGVLDRGPARLAAGAHLQRPPGPGQLGQPAGRGLRHSAPDFHFLGRQRPDGAQHVRHGLQVPALAVRRDALQLTFGVGHDRGIQQLPQVSLAEQVGQQRRVQGQRLRAPLGQRRVALVHERADVTEEQRPAERRRGGRLHLDDADLAAGQVAQQVHQRGHVEDVLQAFAHRLQHDRERRVLPRDLQQLRRTLPLLPQRRPPAGLPPGQQHGPRRALAEPRREQRGRADLGGDDVADLVGLDQRDPGRRWLIGVRHPDDDPVVGVHGLHVHAAVPLPQPRRDGQRPRAVHARPVRAVQHHAPVTQLVPEPLHDQGPVVGHRAGGFPLVGEVTEQVPGGQLVQAGLGQHGRRGVRVRLGQLTAGAPDRGPQLGGPPGGVAVPERQLAGLAGRRGDQHAVGGDVLDPPGGGAEHEHVADPRLVDHLLVEFAHPARMPA